MDDRYVSGIDYQQAFFPQMQIPYAELILTLAGYKTPRIQNYCELGFGLGTTLVTNAATNSVKCWGTDFNSNHVAIAVSMAEAIEDDSATKRICNQDFKTFCSDETLPTFEFIALHGVWSWISVENQVCIKDFVKRKLAPGGILYISYNMAAGSSFMLPIKNLLYGVFEHGTDNSSDVTTRITAAVTKVGEVIEESPQFKENNRAAIERFDVIRKKSPNYIAHELLNKDWQLVDFSELHRDFSSCGLLFGTSSEPVDTIDSVNFSAEQMSVLGKVPTIPQAEELKDFFLSRTFRQDYWLRGIVKLSDTQIMSKLSAYELVSLNTKASDLKLSGRLKSANLDAEIYDKVFDLLKANGSLDVQDLMGL